MKLKKQLLTLLLVIGMVFSLPVTTLAASGDTIVYVTRTGEKYHSDGCQYLRKSQIPISLQDAINSGYSACSRCNPPVLTAQATAPATPAAPAASTAVATQPATVPNTSASSTATDSENQAVVDLFALFGSIHNTYLEQWNTLMQQNPAAIDAVLTQRVALIMQLQQMDTSQFVEHVSLVYLVQNGLAAAGYFTGDFNGLMDIYTIQSLMAYQQAVGLPATGTLDQQSINMLISSAFSVYQ